MLFAPSRQSRIEEMLATIEAECALSAGYTGIGAIRPEVMAAMATVPRDEFVPPEMKPHAFANNALPIGAGQTISQPFIVALMTELLNPEKDDVILEVGTGSGYQAAVLAGLVRRVYSLDILPDLAQRANERLHRLGYDNVEVRAADGYRGWPEHAPFDGIIVTAAASHVPPPLIQQLRRGGRMLIPLGSGFMPQHLVLVEKDLQDRVHTRELLPVQFVPLTGGH